MIYLFLIHKFLHIIIKNGFVSAYLFVVTLHNINTLSLRGFYYQLNKLVLT